MQLCHIPSGSLTRKRGVCMLCVFVLWGNGNHQVLLLPQIQHPCPTGPGSWQSCGHFLGDFPSQSSVEMSTLVAIGIILSEERLHHEPPGQRTHSLLGRAQYWDYVVGFIKHSLHLPCQITLLTSTQHVDLQPVSLPFSSAARGCCACSVCIAQDRRSQLCYPSGAARG